MCGVVGIATANRNGFNKAEVDAFSNMLFLDMMRGEDSTGAFCVANNNNVTVLKHAGHAVDFLKDKEYGAFKGELFARGMFAAGHNRAATRGAISDENAHPFVIDDKIILMQNGTYKGSHTHLKNTQVDTEAVAHVIAETPDIEEALKKVNAAYALVWYDVENKKLHLIRNSERPLYLLTTDTGGLMWASEAGFLYMACYRNGIKYTNKAEELTPHTLVTLTVDGNTWKREDRQLKCSYSGFQANEVDWSEWSKELDQRFGPVHQRATYHNHRNNNVLTLPHTPSTGSRGDVKKSFRDVITAPQYRGDYHVSEYESQVIVATAGKELEAGKTYAMEVLDYIPCNAHAFCTSWFLVLTLMTPTTGVFEKVVVNALIFDKTKEEIGEMLSTTWYTGTLSSGPQRTCCGDGMWVVTAFAHKLIPYNETVTQ